MPQLSPSSGFLIFLYLVIVFIILCICTSEINSKPLVFFCGSNKCMDFKRLS
uniref:ATP synthase F0 subunit 8 n=1 Tax=Planorbella duryi TaxID=129831 RepID=A0A1S6PTP0_9GAST|nr:ATP synthase F0 subunit 8 [Planorbella duryi]